MTIIGKLRINSIYGYTQITPALHDCGAIAGRGRSPGWRGVTGPDDLLRRPPHGGPRAELDGEGGE